MSAQLPLARRLGAGVVRTLAWVVVLASLGVLVVAVLIPRVTGATPFTIETGSMRPGMPPGTLVVVRPVTHPEDIGIGTVITYQLASGDPTVVTHRVVATAYDGRDRLRFQTRGDANNVADQKWVRPVQIRGERWYSVPYVGRLNALFSHRQHEVITYGVAALLALYALSMFRKELRERRRREELDVQSPEVAHEKTLVPSS